MSFKLFSNPMAPLDIAPLKINAAPERDVVSETRVIDLKSHTKLPLQFKPLLFILRQLRSMIRLLLTKEPQRLLRVGLPDRIRLQHQFAALNRRPYRLRHPLPQCPAPRLGDTIELLIRPIMLF